MLTCTETRCDMFRNDYFIDFKKGILLPASRIHFYVPIFDNNHRLFRFSFPTRHNVNLMAVSTTSSLDLPDFNSIV